MNMLKPGNGKMMYWKIETLKRYSKKKNLVNPFKEGWKQIGGKDNEKTKNHN